MERMDQRLAFNVFALVFRFADAEPVPIENAGSFFDGKWVLPFDVVMSVFQGDWWDATQIYRDWVLSNAVWATPGPITQSPLKTASWLTQGDSVWMNTGSRRLSLYSLTIQAGRHSIQTSIQRLVIQA
jgi:hypothetical protein